MKLYYRRSAAALALAVLGLVSAPAAAMAGNDGQLLLNVGDGSGFVSDTSTPLFHDLGLAPGYETTGTLSVKNDSNTTSTLNVQFVDVRDDDNGCDRPETRDGDRTCGDGEGELGRWMTVDISRDVDGQEKQVWSGPLTALEQGVTIAGHMASHAVWPLKLALKLPYAATNETQTDSIGFSIRWTASAVLSDQPNPSGAEVLGIQAFRNRPTSGGGGPFGGVGVTLPFTGTRIGLDVVLFDAGLLTIGSALIVWSRRRRQWALAPVHRADR